MPHKFSNSDKIDALSKWINKTQECIDKVKDAIRDADTMEQYIGVPDSIRDHALQNALKASRELASHARHLIEPYDRIKVSHERYEEAEKTASEVAEPEYADGWQSFQVPVWATERVVRKLKDAKIRHQLNKL